MQPEDGSDRQAMWQGLGDGLSSAVEMAVTPVILTLIGLWVDGRAGTTPWIAVSCALFGMIGGFVKAYYVYVHKSEEEEAKRKWLQRTP